MADNGSILDVRDLSKVYPSHGHLGTPTTAVRNANLSVNIGDTVAIVGESGSGKSTFARLLMLLEAPTSGTISYRGEVVSGLKERQVREYRRRVQMVFQDPMSSLDPRMKVHDILAEPLRALGIDVDEGERVRELLTSVELPASASSHYAHQFSGGQRQRIAIARALSTSPELLIADEPVSALDVSVRAQILNLLSGLVRDFGLTLVFISHDMAVVRHMCRRVVVLYHGDIVETGDAEKIFRNPQEQYTKELVAAVPRIRVARAAAVDTPRPT